MMSFKHVCLYDDAVVSVEDAARNTFIDKNQIGKSTRAEASLNSLQDLNSKCIVSVTHNKSFEFMYFFPHIQNEQLQLRRGHR
jgi:molybdopterin/thiamine biosynthesis adenylyltransferase